MSTKFLIVLFSINTVLAQLVLKRGITSLGTPAATGGFPSFLLAASRSPWVYLALALQGVGYIIWMVVVSRIKLGVATASAGAAFYILVALAAWALYGESLTYVQWLGIGLITIGVTCVSLGPI